MLQLDRVLDTSPEELDAYRRGLKADRQDRQDRQELTSRRTGSLLARMDVLAGTANAKVLLHPTPSRAVVDSGNDVATVEARAVQGASRSVRAEIAPGRA